MANVKRCDREAAFLALCPDQEPTDNARQWIDGIEGVSEWMVKGGLDRVAHLFAVHREAATKHVPLLETKARCFDLRSEHSVDCTCVQCEDAHRLLSGFK